MSDEYVCVREKPDGSYFVMESVHPREVEYGRVFALERDGVHTLLSHTVNTKMPLCSNNDNIAETVAGMIFGNESNSSNVTSRLQARAIDIGRKRADERKVKFVEFVLKNDYYII